MVEPTDPAQVAGRQADGGEVAGRLYDPQALRFDGERGLSPLAPNAVLAAIERLSGFAAPRLSLLEIGPGTGELGVLLARRVGSYIGLEPSEAMLALFRSKLAETPGPEIEHAPRLERSVEPRPEPTLVQADANEPWPAPDAGVDVVFASRSAHWISPEHLASEVARVGRPDGCSVLFGRVVRGPAHPQPQLRRWLHRALWARGLAPNPGPARELAALKLLVQRVESSTWLGEQVVMRWPAEVSPADILARWSSKPGLAGLELAEPLKTSVLQEVSAEAQRVYGSLECTLACREQYALQGVALGVATEVQLEPIDIASRWSER